MDRKAKTHGGGRGGDNNPIHTKRENIGGMVTQSYWQIHGLRSYNQRVAKNLLRSVWKMGNDLKIVDIGEGLFQFKFSIKSQMKWVLDNGPWSFENQFLVLRRWEKGITPRSVKFTTVPMWVQVWGLPFDLINEDARRDIRSGLG